MDTGIGRKVLELSHSRDRINESKRTVLYALTDLLPQKPYIISDLFEIIDAAVDCFVFNSWSKEGYFPPKLLVVALKTPRILSVHFIDALAGSEAAEKASAYFHNGIDAVVVEPGAFCQYIQKGYHKTALDTTSYDDLTIEALYAQKDDPSPIAFHMAKNIGNTKRNILSGEIYDLERELGRKLGRSNDDFVQ